jgi:hypothetical protein
VSGDRARPTAEARRSAWPPTILALAVLGTWAWTRVPNLIPAPPEPEPEAEAEAELIAAYEDEARALLGDLDHGDVLAREWVVERVEGPLIDGRIKILTRHDQRRLGLWLSPRGLSPHNPPVRTEHWDLFYDRVEPADATLDSAELTAMLEALATRIRAHE